MFPHFSGSSSNFNFCKGNFVPVQSLSTVEGSIGILAACMPTVRSCPQQALFSKSHNDTPTDHHRAFLQWRPLFRFVGQGLSSYFSHNASRPGESGFHNSSGDHEFAVQKLAARSSAAPSAPTTRNTSSAKGLVSYHTQHLGVLPPSSPTLPSSVHGWNRGHAKRSESNSSGDSVERMLQGRIHGSRGVFPNEDVEMDNLRGRETERSSVDVGYGGGGKGELSAGHVARPHNTFTTVNR
jgi:hypothetical protein